MKTARGENAEACARECREPGACTGWPECSCPTISKPVNDAKTLGPALNPAAAWPFPADKRRAA